MEKLNELLSRCKCGVFLTVNEHRDYYITAEQALDEAKEDECPPEIEPDVEARMIETDTIVRLQFYPNTPISSYEIWHYDLDAALDEALACLTPSEQRTTQTIPDIESNWLAIKRDAERWQWLRSQHWSTSTICVVEHPQKAVGAGHDCPSGDRLDDVIDAAMNEAGQKHSTG